jgi:hypothetical protein
MTPRLSGKLYEAPVVDATSLKKISIKNNENSGSA